VSDSAQVLVRIDPLAPSEREAVVSGISAWLLSSGVIAEFDRSDPRRTQFAETEWSPGPNWPSVVEYEPTVVFETLLLNGVDICAEVSVQTAFGNSEDWHCSICGAVLSADDLIGRWAETQVEPVAGCGICGWSAPLGDWPVQFPIALVGAPAITFHNWQPLSRSFRDELTARLGGRCRYFWRRI
jgi:hypothetical protein